MYSCKWSSRKRPQAMTAGLFQFANRKKTLTRFGHFIQRWTIKFSAERLYTEGGAVACRITLTSTKIDNRKLIFSFFQCSELKIHWAVVKTMALIQIRCLRQKRSIKRDTELPVVINDFRYVSVLVAQARAKTNLKGHTYTNLRLHRRKMSDWSTGDHVTLPNSKWRQYLHRLFIPVERRLIAP